MHAALTFSILSKQVCSDKKPTILPAFASLVVTDHGSHDQLDVADVRIVPDFRTGIRWVSKSGSFAASALPDVAEQHLALLSHESIKGSSRDRFQKSLCVQFCSKIRCSLQHFFASQQHSQHASSILLQCMVAVYAAYVMGTPIPACFELKDSHSDLWQCKPYALPFVAVA